MIFSSSDTDLFRKRLTHPFASVQDLETESQRSTCNNGRWHVNHLVVYHGELQEVFSQGVLLSCYLRRDIGHHQQIQDLKAKHLSSLLIKWYKPRKPLTLFWGTAGEEGGPAGTWALAGCSSPCLWSRRWCRPCQLRRQSLRSRGGTSPRIWKPGTWQSRRRAAAASWGLGCPVVGAITGL